MQLFSNLWKHQKSVRRQRKCALGKNELEQEREREHVKYPCNINFFIWTRRFRLKLAIQSVHNFLQLESCNSIVISEKYGNSIVWKVSKNGDFSGPYFPAFGLNTEKSEIQKIKNTEKSPYLDICHAVSVKNFQYYSLVLQNCFSWFMERLEIFANFVLLLSCSYCLKQKERCSMLFLIFT